VLFRVLCYIDFKAYT